MMVSGKGSGKELCRGDRVAGLRGGWVRWVTVRWFCWLGAG